MNGSAAGTSSRRRGARLVGVAASGAAVALLLSACASTPVAPPTQMTFFVTSSNPGRGGDLGGLEGADAHCTRLAAAAGSVGRTWRAYLSAQPVEGRGAVHARDRIGRGPWTNAKGVVVATSVANLHSDANRLDKSTALTERGDVVSGRGDAVNLHDILTGSQPDGTAIAGDANTTCGNWTMSEGGAAMVGHHDRIGLNESAPMKSWNSSHQSRGCSLAQLQTTGGGGRFYCFATN